MPRGQGEREDRHLRSLELDGLFVKRGFESRYCLLKRIDSIIRTRPLQQVSQLLLKEEERTEKKTRRQLQQERKKNRATRKSREKKLKNHDGDRETTRSEEGKDKRGL